MHTTREDTDAKGIRLEAAAVSIDIFLSEQDADRILSVKDLTDHVRSQHSTLRHAIENNDHRLLVHIVEGSTIDQVFDGCLWLSVPHCEDADHESRI